MGYSLYSLKRPSRSQPLNKFDYPMYQEKMKKFIEENYEDMLELLRQLCHIPAPSHDEEARAELL